MRVSLVRRLINCVFPLSLGTENTAQTGYGDFLLSEIAKSGYLVFFLAFSPAGSIKVGIRSNGGKVSPSHRRILRGAPLAPAKYGKLFSCFPYLAEFD